MGTPRAHLGLPGAAGGGHTRLMVAMAQLLCALGPGGSGAHNEGHSHTRPACGTASQLPVQQPGRCSGCASGRLLPGEYCFGLAVPLSPPSGARPCQGAVLASSGGSQGGQGTAPSCTRQVSSPWFSPACAGVPLPFLDLQVGGYEVGSDEGCRSALQGGRSRRWVPGKGCGSLPGGGDTRVAS